MAESVQFYWLRGEQSLPLDTIPEGERQPLRVRRGVVQDHAPEVLKQLESGRFVAAAWSSGEQIVMILCHPNVAKGAADTLLVNSPALPRVVLRLSGWDEVPDAAQLLLRAFGSEVVSVDECVAARRELVEWLAAHGQPEMAKVVQHFSSFPFGVRSDALEVINIWRNVLVKGRQDQIDRFLSEVEQRFEGLGWSRDPVLEGQMNAGEHQRDRFYCWSTSPDTRPRVMLCLKRATDRQVRGGTYKIEERASLADLATAIQHALREVIEPAAAAVGLEVTYPRLGPISRVGPTTEAAMRALAEAGDGQWPLPKGAEAHWRAFILTAFRDDVALKPEELTAWFVASGWDEQAATELTNRFYANVALIAEYEEAGRQPA
ncbi:MAG: hypothetical protein L0Z62_25925 [Gemmataceae bacterium]|nr:hypothetical protein [Gemmataceae bacterium]